MAPMPAARTIGGYQILRRIAVGGMGTIDLALNRGPAGFAKLVALKQLHPFIELGPEAQRRFASEARIGAELRHPGIVDVLDYSQDDDGLFIVMEYVHGCNLGQVRRRTGALPEPLAARIAHDVLAALEAAHGHRDQQGRPAPVIHRDLTPNNVLLSDSGEVKITDFGIARIVGAELSRHSGLRGTLAYMSPEQARGEPLDPRSDLFSLGLILLELLRGERVYDAEDDLALLKQAQQGAAARALPAGLRGPLRAALERALQPDPAARFADARAFRAALEPIFADAGRPTREDLAALVLPQLGSIEELLAAAEETTRATVVLDPATAGDEPPRPGAAPAPGATRRTLWPLVLAAALLLAGAAVLGVIAMVRTGTPPPKTRDALRPAARQTGPAVPPGPTRAPDGGGEDRAVEPGGADARGVIRRRRPPRRPRRTGVLVINTLPVWSRVWVDGRARGTTPISVRLPAGKHEVLVRPAGGRKPVRFPVAIRPGRRVQRIIDVSR